jgi:hypothetical protein
MATLPPTANPFDPVLEIEHGTIDGKACAHAYHVAISEKSYEADDSGPGATRDKVLLATVTEDALRMFPINVRRGVSDYLKPRHDSLRTITIEGDDHGWPLPSEPGDFEELLIGLPTGFSKQFQYGLGLKWEYRFFVNAIDGIEGITELVITSGVETTVAPPRCDPGSASQDSAAHSRACISSKGSSSVCGGSVRCGCWRASQSCRKGCTSPATSASETK